MFVNKYKIIKPIGDGSSVNINLPTSQLPGLAGQTEIIENEFVDVEVKKSINEIIDYEKAKFLPIDKDDKLIDDVTYIVNLYDSNEDYHPTTTWADAGFQLEDIQNLKNSFTKTFLRLDFYDNDSNTNQNLLFDTRKKVDLGWRIWLKADDTLLSTPSIDQLVASAELDSSYLPNQCKVYGYLTDIGINPASGENTKISFQLYTVNYTNNSNIITGKLIEAEINDGYFEQLLVPNDTSDPPNQKYQVLIHLDNKVVFDKQILVTNTIRANIVDLIV